MSVLFPNGYNRNIFSLFRVAVQEAVAAEVRVACKFVCLCGGHMSTNSIGSFLLLQLIH